MGRLTALVGLVCAGASALASAAFAASPQGVVFVCAPQERVVLSVDMRNYLRELQVDVKNVGQTEDPDEGTLTFTLNTSETDTMRLWRQKKFHISTERVKLPGSAGRTRWVDTVSQKEILLALLLPGRVTQFRGAACNIHALREHVGVRQNVVAWIERLQWTWPDGGDSAWNPMLWDDGTPRDLSRLDEALRDAFENQALYAVGCYTASKLGYAQGVLDYYQRVLHDPDKARLVRQRLLQDGDPLVHIEPTQAWDFQPFDDPSQRPVAGKLLTLTRGIAAKNYVPGDWAYFQNPDPVTRGKTGYEGSNVIYLGRGKFEDFYNDHDHAYTFHQKLDEVYQWRYGVFSRTEDAQKVHPISAQNLERLGRSTAEGGLVRDFRLVPYFFGYEDLP